MNSDSGAPSTPREGEVGSSLDTQMEGVPWALRCLSDSVCACSGRNSARTLLFVSMGKRLRFAFPVSHR